LKSNSTSARRKNKRLQFQRIQEKLGGYVWEK
jgi:hypothetical protein